MAATLPAATAPVGDVAPRSARAPVFLVWLVPAAAAALALLIRGSGLGARSFWLDEALVVRAARAPWDRFLERLDTSPIGFAILERFMLSLPLPAETALRLPALLAGSATPPLLFVLARRLGLGTAAASAAALLAAANATLAYYGKEAKPYALDGLAAVVIVLLAEAVRDARSRLLWAAYAALGILPWFLHAAPFSLAACDAVLLWLALRGRVPWRRVTALLATHAASLVGLYMLVLRGQMSRRLDDYWSAGFLPPTRSLRVAASWVLERTNDLYVLYFEDLAIPALAITALGVVLLALRRQWRVLAYVLLPWLLVLAASAARLYPYGGHRVLLFLIPGALLAVGVGLAAPLALGRSRTRPVLVMLFIAMMAALLQPAVAASLDRFVWRTHRAEEVAPLVDVLRREALPGDAIYVYYAAVPAYEWYGRDLPLTVLEGEVHRDNLEAYASQVDVAVRSHPRVWFLFSHYWGDERERIVARAARGAHQARAFEDVGASLYLFVR